MNKSEFVVSPKEKCFPYLVLRELFNVADAGLAVSLYLIRIRPGIDGFDNKYDGKLGTVTFNVLRSTHTHAQRV